MIEQGGVRQEENQESMALGRSHEGVLKEGKVTQLFWMLLKHQVF